MIMAGGTSVTKEPATDRFAARFHEAGFTVAFDHRRFGTSGGTPRQIVRFDEQIADWHAAIECAATLPTSTRTGSRCGVSRSRVATSSRSPPTTRAWPARSRRPRWSTAARSLPGRPPLLVPTAGARGSVASLTTPDALDGDRALDPGRRHTDWEQTVAARIVLRLGGYRPGRHASRIRCPLLVVVCDQDRSALPAPALRAAGEAPAAEVVHLTGRRYAPFLESHEQAVAAELSFLEKHLAPRVP
ncbi:alpha/beta hydrolase [Streptomyces griseofuscus]|uniref:alpha/beta hydrolase n=1 Tax=Streptomyces griseofuscus TaxID=146922 RepID=UPI000A71E13C|nr:alpha/beta hydrolase [Streptomyces griseofuscus]